jgi:glycosyltransferase involved in cell wall biosynthesis
MNYNCGVYLEKAIQSVLQQTIKPDFIHIVDDCSEDNSLDIMDQFRDVAIIHVNSVNLGITENFNQAVSRVETEFAFFFDSDNVLAPTFIEKSLLELQRKPDAVIVYTDMFVFGRMADEFCGKIGLQKSSVDYLDVEGYLWRFPKFSEKLQAKKLVSENFIHGNSIFSVKRFREVGGLDGGKPEDHVLWKKMIDLDNFAVNVSEPLLAYRQHSNTQAQNILELKHRLNYLQLEVIRLQEIIATQNIRKGPIQFVKAKTSPKTKTRLKQSIHFYKALRSRGSQVNLLKYKTKYFFISVARSIERNFGESKIKRYLPIRLKNIVKLILRKLS